MYALLKVAGAVVCVYLLVVLMIYMGQRRLLYFPDPTHMAPAQAGLPNVGERILQTPDGARIVTWYGKARPGQPTLLYFHGNGGSLEERTDRIRQFMAQGWGVYIMAYRGYSGSSGYPTEAANVADARLAYGALVMDGVQPETIVLYGESLGTGVASRIAAERKVAGLILESPYTSITDMARAEYPWLPVRLLLSDRYDTEKVLPQVRVPLLILHGEDDELIPISMARQLAKIANEPKKLVVIPDGGHSNLYSNGRTLQAVREFVRGLPRRAND